MARVVEQDFIGKIGDFKLDNTMLYDSIDFICSEFEEKFGPMPVELETDIASTVYNMWLKYEYFDFTTLENSFVHCINRAESLEDLEFEYEGSDWKIESLNENLRDGKYELENIEIEKITK